MTNGVIKQKTNGSYDWSTCPNFIKFRSNQLPTISFISRYTLLKATLHTVRCKAANITDLTKFPWIFLAYIILYIIYIYIYIFTHYAFYDFIGEPHH